MSRKTPDTFNPGQADDSPFVFGGVAAPGQDEADLESPSTPAARYSASQRRRFTMDPRLRTAVIWLVVAVLLVPVTMILPTHVFGQSGLNSSLAQFNSSIAARLNSVGQMGTGSVAGRAMAIYFWQLVAVFVAGAALALNGAVFQGALKNALAAPSTLGIMSGATLGNIIYTLNVLVPQMEDMTFYRIDELSELYASMSPLEYFMATQGQAVYSLIGCAVVVALVLAIAYVAGRGHVSKVGLLVSGQVFTAVIMSIIEMIQLYLYQHGTETQQLAVRGVVGGNVANMTSPLQVAYFAVPVAIGIVIIMVLRHRLNLLAFDEDEAKSMGISVVATRNLAVVVCTVLTAVVVSFCGQVGFVGFLVPHLARMMVGPDFRYLIPTSIALGSAYLLIANYLMNMTGIFQGSLGTLTSLLGIVFFAIMAVRQRARGDVDWI